MSQATLCGFPSRGLWPLLHPGHTSLYRYSLHGRGVDFSLSNQSIFLFIAARGGKPRELRVSISLPHDTDSKVFEERYQRELSRLRECVERSHDQVVSFNEGLPRLAGEAIASRRERLSRHADIAALLDIPLAAKTGAPSIAPVRVEIRRPPPLPVPPKTGLRPEPGITDETYEHILHFIRHQGRSFETAPSTFSMHDEEGLRNIILAQLNGHFKGDAAGEVFRGSGKTDILIEQDNRAAFVGECKLWAGSASLTGALEQLLGYLTWRDSKASLIIFNSKNKSFSKFFRLYRRQ